VANILIHTIEFINDNTYGGFVAGDLLEIYLDDTLVTTPGTNLTDAISVDHNGSPILVGLTSTLIHNSSSIIDINSLEVTFCNSTYLIVNTPQYTYPYGNYSSLADHPSCSVTPVVCDLIVVGAPVVVNATGDTNTDGQITVTASSTNTIEYSLIPFTYGSGQSTGLFTGLLQGTYRIYIRDSINCESSVLVTVGVTYTYGSKLILEYDDLNGFQTKILVTEKNYSGSTTEVCGAGTPFELLLKGNGSDNKFEPLLAVQGNLNLTSESDLQFLELYTNDPDLYRIEYYKDFGSGYVQYNTLKLLPQQYEEDYKFPPYYVNAVSSDGLAELDNFFLIQNDGQPYVGTISLIKLVSLILTPLKLDLDILVACNLYASGMDSTSADDPFEQSYIDFESFYLQDALPSYDFVLRSILEPFGCRIVQWENRWNIIRVEELKLDFDYRLYDYAGDYISNSSYSPVHSIGTDIIFAEANQYMEIRPGYGKIRVNYNLGLKPNILDNGDFRLTSFFEDGEYLYEINKDGWTLVNAGYPISESYESIDTGVAYKVTPDNSIITTQEGGEAYILSDTYSIAQGLNNQLKISIRIKVNGLYEAFFGTAYRSRLPYIKVRLEVKYGSNYLQGDGSWKTTLNEVIFYITTTDQFEEFNIVASQPTSGSPSSGEDFYVKAYIPYQYHAQFKTVALLEAFPTYSGGKLIPDGYRTELREDYSGSAAYMYYYELEETASAASGYDVIEPDDYDGTNNNRRWVKKNRVLTGARSSVSIDFVKVEYLYNNEKPFDIITRSASGEGGNNNLLDKDLIIGSSGNLVTTETVTTSFSLNIHRIPPTVTTTIVTTNILSYSLIYTGYLRNSSGVGWELWTRDGIAEADKLHGIFLKQYASQYKRSWRLLRGSIRNSQSFFGLLNVIEETGDGNRLYLPISLTLDDKRCVSNGEFLELITGEAGSDGTAEAPFNSGFTTGFGASGFN
jgi:hypothetical protein